LKTHQETFDIVAEALLKQGGPSVQNGKCVYKSKNGTKCAAGHLIPDHLYDEKMDDFKFSSVLRNDLVQKILIGEGCDLEFVQQLQDIHDSHVNSWNEWTNHMIEFARINGLSYNILM
jgi:hypothetical protein